MLKKKKNLIFLVFAIVVIFAVYKYIYNMQITGKIGKVMIELGNQTNVYYEEKSINENYKSTITKRFNDKLYYELNIKKNNENVKNIKYTDFSKELYYDINEKEKLAISDYIYHDDTIDENYIDFLSTKAEEYCKQKIFKDNNALIGTSLKNVSSKKINGIKCYEISMKTPDGTEKTYFSKENLLPIKTKLENKGKNIYEKDIIIKQNIVTEDEVKVPEDYTLIAENEYLQYEKDIISPKNESIE